MPEPLYDREQLKPHEGSTVRAFHPKKFGVINYGTLLKVGRKYAQISFLEGVERVPIRDIVGVER